ncbi:MAG: preprotein translocase subunit SecG [Clostridiales bacterium]|nr:preprotein translocase subunit SecG [Clostridiales bacterium]
MLKIILCVIFVLICVFLTVVVLMQEGKQTGLGAIGGMADSYWGKNKGRSLEGNLTKLTTVAAVLFIVLALVLNLIW